MEMQDWVHPNSTPSVAGPIEARNRVVGHPLACGFVRLVTVLGVFVGLTLIASAQDPAAKTSAHPVPAVNPIKSGNTAVAKYDDKTATADDVVNMIKNTGYSGNLTWKNLDQFGTRRIDAFLHRYLGDQYAYEHSLSDKSWKRPASVEKELQQQRDRLLMRQLYKAVVADKVTTPSEGVMRKYYEEHKDNYHVPFSFTMRHLFLSTYEDYTVKEGDTLETIAQNVSGDKSKAALILLKSTHRPPGAKEEKGKKGSETEDEKAPDLNVSLKPGEVLLVPMPKDRVAKVKEQIDSYYKDLQGGAKFEEVASKYSQAASKGDKVTLTPTKAHPLLPKIIEAVKSTPVGSYCKPFETKHGWQIIEVVHRTDDSYRPFEKMKPVIQMQLEREQQKKLADEFIKNAYAKSRILKINMDALKEGANTNDIVATAGDYKYTRGDMLIDFPKKVSPSLTKDQVRDLLKGVTRIQRNVLVDEAERMHLADKPEIKKQIAKSEQNLVAESYVKSLVQQKESKITDAELKEYYDKDKDAFKTLRKLDLYVIALPVQSVGKAGTEDVEKARQKVTDQLKTWKAEIKTLDDFKKIAKEHSAVKPEKSGHVGEVSATWQNGMNGTLESMKTGEAVGPIGMPDKSYLLWAASETPAAVPPFEKIHDKVVSAYKNRMQSTWEQDVRNGFLDKVGYKFLLPIPKKEVPKVPVGHP